MWNNKRQAGWLTGRQAGRERERGRERGGDTEREVGVDCISMSYLTNFDDVTSLNMQ